MRYEGAEKGRLGDVIILKRCYLFVSNSFHCGFVDGRQCFPGSCVLIPIASGHLQEMDREFLLILHLFLPFLECFPYYVVAKVVAFLPRKLVCKSGRNNDALVVTSGSVQKKIQQQCLLSITAVEKKDAPMKLQCSPLSSWALYTSILMRDTSSSFAGLAGGMCATMEVRRSQSMSRSAMHAKSTLIR